MTKRKILAMIIALVMCVSLCACSSEEKTNNSGGVGNASHSDEITVSSEGSYFFFRTDSQNKYIDFLESLEKRKYEILDITILPTTYCRDDCFMITYTERINESQ